MSIENSALPPVSQERDPEEISHFGRWAIKISLDTALGMWAAQKLAYPLQIKMASQPLILVMLNPIAPALADLHDHYNFWLYLTIGGLRSCIFMPTSYFMGRYGKEYVKALAAKRERRTGRQLMWPGKARRGIDHVVSPVRDWLTSFVAATPVLAYPWVWLKGLGRWLKPRVLDNFAKWGWLMVFIRPNQWTLMAAGAKRMNPWVTGAAAVSGELAWLVLVAYMGQHIPHIVLNIFSIF
ncbi:MAG TPA: hypothetical protein VGH44_02525 [Candidatus Saccharimonadia bacterium]|jgi:hypothetical protein